MVLTRQNILGLCHAGLDPASSVFSWIPAFAGMTAFGYLIAGVISNTFEYWSLRFLPAFGMVFVFLDTKLQGRAIISDHAQRTWFSKTK